MRSVISKLMTDPVSGKVESTFILEGLSSKDGLDVIYSLYHTGIVLSTSIEVKELSANGLSDVIAHCPSNVLNLVAVKMAGPLIRASVDRFPSSVKAAIIDTLRYYFVSV